jgi:ABC-type amino acid transport substrate-binding protein
VVLARGDSTFNPKSVQDFAGKRVGCAIDYFSLDFEAKFDSGEIIREDAPNDSANIQKLQAGRLDAILIEKMAALYWRKKLNINQIELKTVYEGEMYEIYFRLHRNKKNWLPIINDALKKLLDDGTIQKIADKYT